MSSFVGRQREVVEVRGLSSRGRLVTLTGAGGAGNNTAYAREFERGRGLSLDRLIGYALAEPATLEGSTEDTGDSGSTALTKREREVAELMSLGLSNKIAAKLTIATRTARLGAMGPALGGSVL